MTCAVSQWLWFLDNCNPVQPFCVDDHTTSNVSSAKVPAQWSHSPLLFQKCSRDNLLPLNRHYFRREWMAVLAVIFLPDNCLSKHFVNIGGTLVQSLGPLEDFLSPPLFTSAVRAIWENQGKTVLPSSSLQAKTSTRHVRKRRECVQCTRDSSLNSTSQWVQTLNTTV